MTFVDVLVMVAFGPPLRLASLLAGGGLLSLPLDRRLVVGHAPLHLLEQAVLLHLLFQRLEGRLDLIVDDDDLGGDDHQADNRSRRGIHRFQPRATVGGATSMAWRRPAPDTNAAAIVAKISRDCSTTSPAWPTMRQRHPFSAEMATTSIQTLSIPGTGGSSRSRTGCPQSGGHVLAAPPASREKRRYSSPNIVHEVGATCWTFPSHDAGVECELPSHPSQPPEVRGHSGSERRVQRVPDAEVSTGLFHHPRDCRVVDVADPREQVMLDLKVQSAEKPRGSATSTTRQSRGWWKRPVETSASGTRCTRRSEPEWPRTSGGCDGWEGSSHSTPASCDGNVQQVAPTSCTVFGLEYRRFSLLAGGAARTCPPDCGHPVRLREEPPVPGMESVWMDVVAISAEKGWRWRIVGHAGEVVEQSREVFG